jgi:hypothetical protein
MKPELQRIRIAEARGFDESHWLELGGGIVLGTSACLPDYPNDLNAMHEAMKTLNPIQGITLCWHLNDMGISGEWEILTATAAQLAEAFLRTLNLWKE